MLSVGHEVVRLLLLTAQWSALWSAMRMVRIHIHSGDARQSNGLVWC